MGVGQSPFSVSPNFKRLLWRLIVLGVLVLCFHLLLDWTTTKIMEEENMPLMLGLLIGLLLAYAILLAIPFMPGIEVGVSLLLLRGAEIAPFVYVSTVLGLTFAYVVGRSIPYEWLKGFFADLRMIRVCELLERLQPLSRTERLAILTARLPGWLRPIAGRARYLLLALLLNMPGNMVLGGGGGLAFTAGFSQLFRPLPVLLTIALAVLPVPLGVWLYGTSILVSE